MLLAVASIQLSSKNDSPGKQKVKLIVRRCSVWSGSAKSRPTPAITIVTHIVKQQATATSRSPHAKNVSMGEGVVPKAKLDFTAALTARATSQRGRPTRYVPNTGMRHSVVAVIASELGSSHLTALWGH